MSVDFPVGPLDSGPLGTPKGWLPPGLLGDKRELPCRWFSFCLGSKGVVNFKTCTRKVPVRVRSGVTSLSAWKMVLSPLWTPWKKHISYTQNLVEFRETWVSHQNVDVLQEDFAASPFVISSLSYFSLNCMSSCFKEILLEWCVGIDSVWNKDMKCW